MLLNRLSKKHFTTTAPLLVLVAILIATLIPVQAFAAPITNFDTLIDDVTEENPQFRIGSESPCKDEPVPHMSQWFSWFQNNPRSLSTHDDAMDSLLDAFDFGYWAVSYVTPDDDEKSTIVTVHWVEDLENSLDSDFIGDDHETFGFREFRFRTSSPSTNYKSATISFPQEAVGHSGCDLGFASFSTGHIPFAGDGVGSPWNTYVNNTRYMLFNNAPTDYPDGYQGADVPDSFIINSQHYIDISYQVNNTRITANYTGNLDSIFGDSLYRIEYKLFNADDPEDLWELDSAAMFCGEAPPPLAPTQDTSLYCQFEYDVGHHGDYALMVFPFINDNFDEPHEANARFVAIVIDGSTYSGTTTDMDCDGEGLCLGAPTFEDCDLADLGCHFRNFTKSLQMLLSMLFIPKSGFITAIIGDFRNVFETSLGFLAQPVLFILDLLATAVSGTSNTECSYSFPNYFNNPLNITFCTLEDEFPTQWELIKNFIRAFSAFGLLAILHRKYINVISEGVSR